MENDTDVLVYFSTRLQRELSKDEKFIAVKSFKFGKEVEFKRLTDKLIKALAVEE